MKALIIVDMQNDFMPDGALPVEGGREIIPAINALMNEVDLVVASRDFHPEDHISFASNHDKKGIGDVVDGQILWPDHCIQHTRGSQLVDGLEVEKIVKIVDKAYDRNVDSYSAFGGTDLHQFLQDKGVDEVIICGVATDYCVKYTALDAEKLGYRTLIAREACRAVDQSEGKKVLKKSLTC
ncbi:MAG: nicotinamidase [Simkaniaceae bacterium]|nr:nicotinamidase [Simkaniaceae bacterium]